LSLHGNGIRHHFMTSRLMSSSNPATAMISPFSMVSEPSGTAFTVALSPSVFTRTADNQEIDNNNIRCRANIAALLRWGNEGAQPRVKQANIPS
jgi:hypothetical protein